MYLYHIHIRRPRPLPRQGRRLGPPEVWNLALGSQAKAHAIKATTLSATCSSHLHAPAICFSGGSRLPFARPQTPQTLPQASKATTLTATCPCHLFFREFKTAVWPAWNPPNASAGLQGNNSYSYMPLPSVFQGVQDCRLTGLNPSKLPQASKATTLTATCPCHLFFREFKPAVCQPAKPPKCFPAAPMPFASSGTTIKGQCFPAAPMPFASPGIVLLWWFKPAVCPPAKPPKCFPAAPMPFASPGIVLLWWFKPAVCQPAKPPKCFPAAPMPFASPGIVLLWWFKPAVCQPAKGDDEAPQLVAPGAASSAASGDQYPWLSLSFKINDTLPPIIQW